MNRIWLRQQLIGFLNEDIGFGDQTSQAIFGDEIGVAVISAKSQGIFCGTDVIIEAYRLVSDQIKVKMYKKDGEAFVTGEELARINGPIIELLSTERVVLNLIQRLSGIASLTHEAVQLVAGTGVKISDTRKTTPGLRMLEKYAVVCGGGINHRFGLDHAVLIKDNHIAQTGSVSATLQQVKRAIGHLVKIEVEVENEEQLKEAIEEKPDLIMLDNCSPKQAADWCKLIPESITVELSGRMTKEQLKDYAKTGVDVISMGALTHSVKAKDISMNILVKEGGGHA
ncbi:carboxylating nicotinate-nucleotide diphosphorylase [Amphibacillus sediminis]|uniref:carboxylating nicotinate-nucleotide diphosphorylase n=1 Tax=Amphibacillus sediminis TaxID=360185 RepID=UPI000829C2C4|nr:carboxylating nicotinate-nucleotide diphosphorylase [Amphibacillus sediminis]